MFTGIITDIGTVRSLVKTGDTRIEISTAFNVASINIGASICCSGACMTVTQRDEDWFAVEASAETLSKTVLGSWKQGTRINLEGDSRRLSFQTSDELKGFIAPKGSVTLDGVSLTVNEVQDDTFGVNLIAHTQKETTFGNISPGDTVNVEIDMLARYVARLLEIEQTKD